MRYGGCVPPREVYRGDGDGGAMVELPPPGMTPPPFGRNRHPFFMHDMIRRQSVAARATRRAMIEAPEGDPIPPPTGRLLCVGLGTSFHAALATAEAARGALGDRIETLAATSFDVLQEPNLLRSPATALVFSAGGATALTVAAQHRLKERGIPQVLITSEPGTPSERIADRTIHSVHAKEEAWTHTVSFTAGLVAAGTLLEQWSGGAAKSLLNEDALTNAITEALATEGRIVDLVDAFADRDRLLLVGSGAAEASAREAALKLREGAGRFCASVGVEELLHGVLPSLGPRSAVLAISGSELERRRALEGLTAAKKVGAQTLLVDSSGGAPGEEIVSISPVPAPLPAAVVQVVPFQLLAYWTAVGEGRNPDVMGLDDPHVMEARRSFGI